MHWLALCSLSLAILCFEGAQGLRLPLERRARPLGALSARSLLRRDGGNTSLTNLHNNLFVSNITIGGQQYTVQMGESFICERERTPTHSSDTDSGRHARFEPIIRISANLNLFSSDLWVSGTPPGSSINTGSTVSIEYALGVANGTCASIEVKLTGSSNVIFAGSISTAPVSFSGFEIPEQAYRKFSFNAILLAVC